MSLEYSPVYVQQGNEHYVHVIVHRPDLIGGCRICLPDHTTLEQAIAVAKVLYPDREIEVR